MTHVAQCIPKMRPRFAGGEQKGEGEGAGAGGGGGVVGVLEAGRVRRACYKPRVCRRYTGVPVLWAWLSSAMRTHGSTVIDTAATRNRSPYLILHGAMTLRATFSSLPDSQHHMPHPTSAVTFVAIGNGAPDLSSNISAIRNGDWLLSTGALTGAAMFVQCVVAGEVMRVSG